ncbi:hypothetical protein Trydic_g14012 [Trypoxylus dichotomus]
MKKCQLLATLAFLRRCRDQNVTPTFVKIQHHIRSTTARKIIHRTENALTRERVRYTYHELNQISTPLFDLHLELSKLLHEYLWKTIDEISYEHSEHHFNTVTKKHVKKFEKLKPKKTNTQPELYICKTVINLSTLQLSHEQAKVLAKELNFAVAPTRIPKEEIITQVECAIRRLPAEEAEEIRHKTCRILQKPKPPARNITKEERKALEDIRRNKNLIVVRADKGNATVRDRQDYNMKIQMLLDTDHYKKLNNDPTTKRHNTGNPLRPIVSTCGSPTYELAKYVANNEHNTPGTSKTFVKNSEHVIEILQQHEITKEDLLVSFDVESLLTNVPVEETLEIIKQQLTPKGLQPDLINLARLCLTSTYFLWNGEFYEQASGAAMGSPLSPVIANIFTEASEHEAIESSRMKPKCWYRYVDDIFVIWPHGPRTLEEFLQHINKQHVNVNFTMEIEEDGNLPFLDVLVEPTDNQTGPQSVSEED